MRGLGAGHAYHRRLPVPVDMRVGAGRPELARAGGDFGETARAAPARADGGAGRGGAGPVAPASRRRGGAGGADGSRRQPAALAAADEQAGPAGGGRRRAGGAWVADAVACLKEAARG